MAHPALPPNVQRDLEEIERRLPAIQEMAAAAARAYDSAQAARDGALDRYQDARSARELASQGVEDARVEADEAVDSGDWEAIEAATEILRNAEAQHAAAESSEKAAGDTYLTAQAAFNQAEEQVNRTGRRAGLALLFLKVARTAQLALASAGRRASPALRQGAKVSLGAAKRRVGIKPPRDRGRRDRGERVGRGPGEGPFGPEDRGARDRGDNRGDGRDDRDVDRARDRDGRDRDGGNPDRGSGGGRDIDIRPR